MPAGDQSAETQAASGGTEFSLPARFEFASAQRIIFGVGTRAELPRLVGGADQRVFCVLGASTARHAALLDTVRATGAAVATWSVAGEPTVGGIEDGVRVLREFRATTVVGLGGGSVVDAGKALAALAPNPGAVFDYLEVVGRGLPLPQLPLPYVAVPTTAGTGAEVTRNAVLAVPEARVKVSLRSAAMLPRVALIDPELTLGLSPAVTAATGMDALTQLIEAYLSCRANPMTDALCRDGIGRVARALPRAFAVPGDLAARSDLALGALYSGLALANAGLGAVHGFAGPIGGMFPAPHGAVCAALLAPVLRANLAALRARAPAHPVLARWGEVACWINGDTAGGAEEAATACAELARRLAIPRLGHWGVHPEHVPGLVAKAQAASSMKGNPITLTPAELECTLTAAV